MALQENNKIKHLAIISPNQNAYSETFIQAHRQLPARVFYYYGGHLPVYLDGYGFLPMEGLKKALYLIKNRFLFKSPFTFEELCLIKSFRENNIQVVLAEYGMVGVAVRNICQHLNIPLVVHFHGYDASVRSILDRQQQAYSIMFQQAKAVVVVSRAMERRILSLGCPADKIIYAPYGPNPAFFPVEPLFTQKLFVSVGRFVDKKAPYYTILAFKEVLKSFPDARLVMAGDGPLLNTCRNLMSRLGIEKQISLPGVITADVLRSYLQDALAFVQHSITADNGDSEGTPVGILEASAAGIPVIATIHAGIPDVIIDGETGLLVEEHDVDGMAQAMISLLNDVSLAKKMGAAGKVNIKTNFPLEKHLQKLTDALSL